MAQMFGSLPSLLPTVLDVFNKMVNNIPNINSGTRNGNVLRLALGKDIKAKNGATRICGNQNSNCDIYAATYIPHMTDGIPNDLQGKYRFADSMIVFCPCFFLPASDPNALPSDQQALSSKYLLDKLRTPGMSALYKCIHSNTNIELTLLAGQTVVHEWAHLTWIQNANVGLPETYGFKQCADLYIANNGAVDVLKNADSFANFASYHAYNQEPYAPTDGRPGFSCKDVWPRLGGNNAVFSPDKIKDTFP